MIIQAAVDGCLDYREARLTDPRWDLKFHLLLLGLEYKNSRHLEEVEMHNHLNIVLTPNLVAEDYTKHRKASWKCYDEIRYSYRPQIRPTTLAPTADARNAWIQQYGDPHDPAVAAKIDEVAESIVKRAQARRHASGQPPVRTVRLPKRRV